MLRITILNMIPNLTASQCSCCTVGVMWDCRLAENQPCGWILVPLEGRKCWCWESN